MNHDDIVRMAREAGYIASQFTSITTLERFAAIVAAAEREAVVRQCAGTVENFYQEDRFYCRSARTEILDHFGIER